jgi:hypothetical protein
MKEGLTFVWLVWFTALHLGGSNGGTDFNVDYPSPRFNL